MSNRHSAILCFAYLWFVCARGAAQPGSCDNANCKNLPAWQAFSGFSLRLGAPGNVDYDFWRGSVDKETDDIQIDVEETLSRHAVRGRILLIGGHVMALQGPIAEPGYEIDALDGPMLELQLVEKVLSRVLPGGPTSVHATAEIDFTDKETGIQIATPSAGGVIQAPWRATGRVSRLASGGVQYQLALTSRKSEQDAATRTQVLSGKLFEATRPRIDDRLRLSAWTLFRVGPQSKEVNGSRIIDYGAAPTAAYKTVADVRKEIEAEESPGQPDHSKDFTGFWKTNCDDAFGLQIKHIGTDGEYSVVFCGPGGCENPAQTRLTFITKDPHYQILSADQIRLADGDIYHRCTNETNPILKYQK